MDRNNLALPFFTRPPAHLSESPPLGSALQAIETSLLLLSIGRYPAALVVLGQAIESTIKAAFKISPTDRKHFQKLRDLAASKIQVPTEIDSRLTKFRNTRNAFIHYGYSPNDDERSIQEILNPGLPYLELLLLGFYQFDLPTNLVPWIGKQYRIARGIMDEEAVEGSGRERFALSALEHAIRLHVQPTFISSAENDVLFDSEGDDHKFRVMLSMKAALEEQFNDCWFFDCPLCNGVDCLGGDLDADALGSDVVQIVRVHCLACGFELPETASRLANLVCAEQIENQREAILSGFL